MPHGQLKPWLPPSPARTDQLVCNLVHDVGVIQPAALVLPPALDVDAGLLLKVGQVEVVPAGGGRRGAQCPWPAPNPVPCVSRGGRAVMGKGHMGGQAGRKGADVSCALEDRGSSSPSTLPCPKPHPVWPLPGGNPTLSPARAHPNIKLLHKATSIKLLQILQGSPLVQNQPQLILLKPSRVFPSRRCQQSPVLEREAPGTQRLEALRKGA